MKKDITIVICAIIIALVINFLLPKPPQEIPETAPQQLSGVTVEAVALEQNNRLQDYHPPWVAEDDQWLKDVQKQNRTKEVGDQENKAGEVSLM